MNPNRIEKFQHSFVCLRRMSASSVLVWSNDHLELISQTSGNMLYLCLLERLP